MAEAAGLALSVVGIGALFTTCIQCFDIVVGAKNFSITYELLSAQLELEHLRFLTWGQSVGLALAPNANNRQKRNKGLDQPHVRPVVMKHLLCIKHLLDEAAKLNTRYVVDEDSSNAMVQTGVKSRLFEHTYSRFKRRVQENQKQTSPWKVTRWTLHDQQSFESTIQSLRTFVDGLEKITKSLEGVYERQQRILREEVEQISDIESLNLVHNASSANDRTSSSASHRLLSDAASQQLGSIRNTPQRENVASSTAPSSRLTTYYTAPTVQSQRQDRPAQEQQQADGEIERSATQQLMPQNQRLVHAHQARGGNALQDPSTLHLGLARSGQALARTRHEDLKEIESTLTSKLRGSQVERSLCRKLKECMSESIPFISVAPINENIFDLLASIEGPPGSPYEGGVFYIRMVIPKDFPFKSPACRFITKVYHPNIDPAGNICLEVLSTRWNPAHGRIEKLLLAICALLDDPCVEDPLVPEIAETFMRDRETYHHNARHYTALYASGPRPNNLEDITISISQRGPQTPDINPTRSSAFAARYLNSLPSSGVLFQDVDSFEEHPSAALDLCHAIAFDALGYRFPKHQNTVSTLANARNLSRAWVELLFLMHKYIMLSKARESSHMHGSALLLQEMQLVALCCQHMLLNDETGDTVPNSLPGDSRCLNCYLVARFIRRRPVWVLGMAWHYTTSNSESGQEEIRRSLRIRLFSLRQSFHSILDNSTWLEEFWILVRVCKSIEEAGPSSRIFLDWVAVIETKFSPTYLDSFVKYHFETAALDHNHHTVEFNLRSMTLLVCDHLQ